MEFLEDLSPEERQRYVNEKKERERLDEKKILLKNLSSNLVKYRCEQVNTTSVDDILRSNSIIKTQYGIGIDLNNKVARVKLDDYIYSINPSLLNIIFDFIKLTEFIKHDVYLDFDDCGKIDRILNKKNIHKHWISFLESEEFETEFIRKLRNKNPDTLHQIIGLGNKQFAENSQQEENYRRELFYLVFFDRYLLDFNLNDLKTEDFNFRSILLPDTIIPMKNESRITTTQDANILKYTKKGIAIISDKKKAEIKEKYDKYQKPEIKYSFTEYYLESNLEVDFNKDSRLPISARVEFNEGIRHNIESKCSFTLRKLE